jgi:hypothetical protein
MDLLRGTGRLTSFVGAPVTDDRCACLREQPRVSRGTAGPFTWTAADVTRDRCRDPRGHVHVSCDTAAGVEVTATPAHDSGRAAPHDGSGRPARRTSMSPNTGRVVMLARESVEHDGRRRLTRRPRASDATAPAASSTREATKLAQRFRVFDTGIFRPLLGLGGPSGARRCRMWRRGARSAMVLLPCTGSFASSTFFGPPQGGTRG